MSRLEKVPGVVGITTLSDSDESLCNVLVAEGPGDGLARELVVLRDEASIAAYGEYVVQQSFGAATDYADLLTQAQAYLNEHRAPLSQFEVRALFEDGLAPTLERGDTVRIVDPRSGLLVDTRILEEARAFGPDGLEVRLILNRPRPGLVDTILKVTDDGERERAKLGLPAPLGLRARTAKPGVAVQLNPFASSRAVGVEVHASIEPGFAADASTLKAKGPLTRFLLEDLAPGVRWYVTARSYDNRGELGEFAEHVSAISGFVDSAVIDPGLQERIANGEAAKVVQDANRAVWDRAAAITEDLKVVRGVLDDSVKQELDGLRVDVTDTSARIAATNVTLDGQASRINQAEIRLDDQGAKITATEVGLSGAYAEIGVNATGISLTAAKFDPFAFLTEGGEVLLTEAGEELASEQAFATDELGVSGAYARIDLEADRITSVVSSLNNPAEAAARYSVISQQQSQIDQRVVFDGVVAAVNISPEGVRISGQKIQLNGQVAVTGNVIITDSQQTAHRFEVRDNNNVLRMANGNIGGLPWGSSTLPANQRGIWGDGAGVWLTAYPRVVKAGFCRSGDILTSYTVAPGRLLIGLVTPHNVEGTHLGNLVRSGDYQIYFQTSLQALSSFPLILHDGTHNSIRIIMLRLGDNARFFFNYLLLDVPA